MKANEMITLEKATSEQAKVITEIARQSFLESHRHSAPPKDIDFYVANSLTESAIAEELSHDSNIFRMVCIGGKPVGFSKIVLDSPIENVDANNVTKLERIYVLEKFHGLKLGLKLMEHSLEISKAKKQKGMWLYTWIENKRAIGFYKRNGFEIIGQADFKISENHANPNHLMYLEY